MDGLSGFVLGTVAPVGVVLFTSVISGCFSRKSKKELISRTKYNSLFGIDSKLESSRSKQKAALKAALDIRKFEIDLYWKRATYFWALIVAAFGALGLIKKFGVGDDFQELPTIIISLGFVLSFGWYLANRGSKMWQENWENHVDMLEDRVVGPLYKVVFRRPEKEDPFIKSCLVGPGRYSVSKINQLISVFVFLIWSIMLIQLINNNLHNAIQATSKCWESFITNLPIGFALSVAFMMYVLGKTDGGDYKNDAILRKADITNPQHQH